jgi:CHAD domain-containing protein
VRVVAQARLQRVLEEAARVEVGADPEAIHDFRVALRRLRAWLRAFRPYLSDTVRHGPERRLRSLSRLAGRARDLEVQYQWLTGPRQRRFGPARNAARWLAEEIGREQARARRRLAESLFTELPQVTAKLTAQLRHYRRDTALEEPSFQAMTVAMAEALRRATETLAGTLQRVRRPEQVAEAHVARIAIKRLRYLLEAFGRNPRSAASIVRHPGDLRLLLRGESLRDLVTEGGRALGHRMCGRSKHGLPGPWLDVSINADGPHAILGAWLNRMLELARRDHWAPVECEVTSADDTSLRARVRGVRLGAQPRLTSAVILPGSFVVPGVHGLHAEVMLAPRAASRRHAGRRKAAVSPNPR